MIRETKTLHEHCVYCGKKAEYNCEIEDYQKYDYYYCNCYNASREENINNQIAALKLTLPTESYAVVRRIERDEELKRLKRKYDDVYRREE